MKPTKITKYWPIHKVLETVPDSVELMLEVGLHCFGCSANTEELLHEGMKIHGFSDEEIDDFVQRLNLLYKDQEESQLKKPSDSDKSLEMIREGNKQYYKIAGLLIAESAYKALHELQTKLGIQIKVEAGGCNGYTYIYEYHDTPQPDEKIYTLSPDLDIFMSDFTYDKLHSSVVEYESGLQGSGLVFNNPNTKDACHCGSSVGF
jgi:iron-sulfur cluster assembly protein